MTQRRPPAISIATARRRASRRPWSSGLVTQNGLAWSPDRRTMYLSDSHAVTPHGVGVRLRPGQRDAARAAGVRRHDQHPGRPDGAAIDVDGCYWTCANDAGQLHRFTPEGKLDRSIALPFAKPSMCSFGGDDMKTMLVTSISAGAPAGDLLAGAVLMLDPGVAGMPEQRSPAGLNAHRHAAQRVPERRDPA